MQQENIRTNSLIPNKREERTEFIGLTIKYKGRNIKGEHCNVYSNLSVLQSVADKNSTCCPGRDHERRVLCVSAWTALKEKLGGATQTGV